MAILGLLLVLASGAIAVGLLLANTDSTSLAFYSATYDVRLDRIVLTGIAVGFVFALGLGLVLSALRRGRTRRREARALERDRARERDRLQERNAALESELAARHERDGGEPGSREHGGELPATVSSGRSEPVGDRPVSATRGRTADDGEDAAYPPEPVRGRHSRVAGWQGDETADRAAGDRATEPAADPGAEEPVGREKHGLFRR